MIVLRKSFYIRWSAGRSPRVHKVNPGQDHSITNGTISLLTCFLICFSNCYLMVGLSQNLNEARKKLNYLGLGYISIHACKYDCELFWKEFEQCEQCRTCGTSRWKIDDGKGKKIPHKILHYFPLKPRLQRLFLSSKIVVDIRWHKDKRVNDENFLRHPADGKAWKDFDKEFPLFSQDSRNVWLGLAIDGFNPFGNMSNS